MVFKVAVADPEKRTVDEYYAKEEAKRAKLSEWRIFDQCCFKKCLIAIYKWFYFLNWNIFVHCLISKYYDRVEKYLKAKFIRKNNFYICTKQTVGTMHISKLF